MKIAQPAQVLEVVSAAAAEFRALCIRRTGTIYVRSTNLSRALVPYPPLRCEVKVGDADLSTLPRAVYATRGDLTPSDIGEGFDAFFNLKLRHDQHPAGPRAALRRVFPGFPFTTHAGTSVVTELAQLLYIGGWYDHDRVVRAGSISCAGFEVSSSALRKPGGYRVLKRGLGVAVPKLLDLPLRPVMYGSSKTGAVYQHLMATLPEMSVEIDAVVGAAVHGGEEVQEALCRSFDIDHSHVDRPLGFAEVKQALATLSRSSRFPYAYIKGLLSPILDDDAFIAVFGLPDDWKGLPYTKAAVADHTKFLLSLRAQMIEKAHDVPNPITSGSEAVLLQHLIR